MFVLSVAVVVLAAIVVLNLAVTVAVIRRLREQRNPPPDAAGDDAAMAGGPDIGAHVPDFTATTDQGTPMSRADLPDRTVIGFFSTSCSACTEDAPRFTAAAQALAENGVAALSVVQRKRGDDAEELVSALAPGGPVVVEPAPGPVLRGWRVSTTPAYFLVGPGGAVEGKSVVLADVTGPAAETGAPPAVVGVHAGHDGRD
jgi:thiol-disulfide isomerase/thioredoxin